MGPGVVDQRNTDVLSKTPLKAKNRGDIASAVISAAYYAKKFGKTMYVYAGSSYGTGVWRASDRASEYLNGVNNTGSVIISVTPELVVSRHAVTR